MTREDVQAWLDRYVEAWLSYDREQIESLFAPGVEYRYHPYDEAISGRDAVVASWLGEGDSEDASTRDEPGTYEAAYKPVAVDGDVAVAVGTSTYFDRPGGKVIRLYDNCYVIEFDGDGRCTKFTEWYVKRPAP
jgi:SnoaL-like protein